MGKKAKEYKSGDFIFAKVKGYPAWPARVQRLNGKKYFVYFYGTGETANLAPNMIFDYVENKDKFLTKTVKRRDFNDGVKQIQHDFANNVPLEQVIGAKAAEMPAEEGDDTAIDFAINETMDTTGDTTTADDTTAAADTTANASQDTVEDSDDPGALIIDEGKQGKAKKAKTEPAKTPAKETPAKETPVKPKTPRGRSKKDEAKEDQKEVEEEKKEEEIISRSGRKIRPKRYIDEQTEENATLPTPHPKKRRANSSEKDKDSKEPPSKIEKDAAKEKVAAKEKEQPAEKNIKHFNAVIQSDLEDLKEPFKPADPEKEDILIACLPSGQYIGVKLFQSRPNSFRNDAARLQWDKQAATNALTLKMQLEKGQITPQSVVAQLVMDLNLTDEEKATLDKDRETEEKKYRVQFLKTEMKLIELDAKIKTCLCLEKADTDLCLKLLDEMAELDVKPLMLLKHPTCLETIKRMRAYVGNTPSWDLSESDAIVFSKQAHRIRKHCDTLYKYMKELFTEPAGLSFWEFFSERVLQFKKVTASLNADELLEMVHEPLGMTTPTSHTMRAAIDAANEGSLVLEEPVHKKKNTPAKAKKAATTTPTKPPLKRQSSRKQQSESDEKTNEKDKDKEGPPKKAKNTEKDKTSEKSDAKEAENTREIVEVNDKDASDEKTDKNDLKTNGQATDSSETAKEDSRDVNEKISEENISVDGEKAEEPEKKEENGEKEKEDGEKEKEDAKEVEKEQEADEPRAKRSRGESKRTDPPSKSPARRKAKV